MAQALGHAHRLELLEHVAQGMRSVEELSKRTRLSFANTSQAVELNPAAVTFQTPDQFKWRDPTDQAATNQVILQGDPNKPGSLYININKFNTTH